MRFKQFSCITEDVHLTPCFRIELLLTACSKGGAVTYQMMSSLFVKYSFTFQTDWFSAHAERNPETYSSIPMWKMNSVVTFLVLCAVASCVASPCLTWKDYDTCPEQLRTHIDTAIKEANKQFKKEGKHINFYKLEKQNVTSEKYFVNARLRPTTCKYTGAESGQRKNCSFLKPTMVIDCVVCKQKIREIVNCMTFKDRQTSEGIPNECFGYHIGGSHLMSLKSGINEQQIGCVGCI